MPLYLLDTDVLIDVLRGYPPALDWLRTHPSDHAGIPGFASLELIAGCANQLDAKRVETLVQHFPIYWPGRAALGRAHDSFARVQLSHRVGIADLVIAHTALDYEATLYTFNQRHFNAIDGLRTQQPYTR